MRAWQCDGPWRAPGRGLVPQKSKGKNSEPGTVAHVFTRLTGRQTVVEVCELSHREIALAALEAVPTPFSKRTIRPHTRFILEHSPAKDLTARLVFKMQIPMRVAPALARGYLGRDFLRGPRGRILDAVRIIVIPAERLHSQRIYNLVLSRRPNSRVLCTELHLPPQLKCFRRQTRLLHRQDMLASSPGVAQVMVAVDEHGGSAEACGVATQEHRAQRKPMRRASSKPAIT
jgi:hypothetical protein